MASPPEVLLEPEDSEAFQAMLGAIRQIKRGLSLKVGTHDTPLESMHLAKTMRDMLGDSPSQARVSLVAAQGQLSRGVSGAPTLREMPRLICWMALSMACKASLSSGSNKTSGGEVMLVNFPV